MEIELGNIGKEGGEKVSLEELKLVRANLQGRAAYWALRDQVNPASNHRENLVRYAMCDTQLGLIDRAIKRY